ncbi:MAG: DUF5694 domain-containing protein [Defluviitaleaceae bacterium]|nr:DUF5694 domain-containing protein [Defluviitaleaceae bacterium]
MNAQVMTLGTFHFNQEGLHYLNIQSDARQSEVCEVVDRISKFKPTKIAVERVPADRHGLDMRFQKYLSDGIIDVNHIEDVNEIVMLGFPIAKANGIKELHTIDYMNEWLRGEAEQYAEQNAPVLFNELNKKSNEYIQYLMQHLGKSIPDILAVQNSHEAIQKQHSDMFLIVNPIGAYDNYIGSAFLSSWFERNLKIFANMQSICKDDDRLLVIIGAAHLATLNSMINDYYKMDLVSPLEYLK